MATISTYKAPEYDEDKYRSGISTQFYRNAIDRYRGQAEQQRAAQLGEAQRNQQSALKQAYVTRLQNEKKMNENLATQGIRGGATETANLRLANQYGQARAAANSDYLNSVNQINQSINQNIADYQSDMESRAEEYVQNQANARWQAEREDSLNEYNSSVEYWSNYYMDFYSGYSKKDAKKAAKKVEARLKEAQAKGDAQEIMRLQQQMRGIRARLGVIKNK